MLAKILILAVIGAFIGWITNMVAIKMLFKPVLPVKVMFFTLQGVFPKRQAAMAKSLGGVVEKELIGLDDFKSGLITDENISLVQEKLKGRFEEVVNENIPPVFLAMAGEQINKIIDVFTGNNNDFYKEIFNEILSSNNSIDISKIVEEKVCKMDFSAFEKILLDLIKKELKFIEYIGGVLGFLIGVIQGLIVTIG